MNCVATLPILLVVNHQRHRGGGCECSKITRQGECCLALPKTDVTKPKGNCTCRDVFWGTGVFTDPQQKEKCHDN